MIRVAVVDDHVVLSRSLALLVGMNKEFEVVLEAQNGKQFFDELPALPEPPHVVLLDITMPVMDGLATATWLKNRYPDVKPLILTAAVSDVMIIRMLRAGARGYLAKDCEPEELYEAIRQVHANCYFFNEHLTSKRQSQSKLKISRDNALSVQELTFMRLACTEMTYKEIASEMKVSHRTIDGYRDAIFRKLNVSCRMGIALYAIRNRIVLV
jgi:DNA-binding NarL/FixJ family response regulator